MRLFRISRVFNGRESGLTLLETVVTLFLLATVAVTFLSGLITSTEATFTTDEQATAESLARSQMEWAQNASYNATGYLPASIPADQDYVNYSANITAESLGSGLQKITVSVNRSDEPVFTLEGYKVNR